MKLIELSRSLTLVLMLAIPVKAHAQTTPEADDENESSAIVVTARRLDAARDSIQPALGANATTLTRSALS